MCGGVGAKLEGNVCKTSVLEIKIQLIFGVWTCRENYYVNADSDECIHCDGPGALWNSDDFECQCTAKGLI